MSTLVRLFAPDQIAWQTHPTQPLLMQVFENRASGIGYDALLVKVLAGDRIGWHVHPEATETIYLVSGTGQLFAAITESDQVNAVGQDLIGGMVATIPIGIRHAVSNMGTEPLIIFAVHAPATL